MKRRDFLIGASLLTGLPFATRAFDVQETSMRKLTVFNNVSLDGYFTDAHGDMSWAHKQDAEWGEFTAQNAGGEAELLFGRVTYEMMASFWPTPKAAQIAPAVAEGMNRMRKTVFSRTLTSVTWQNSQLINGDLVTEVRRLKAQGGPDMLLMGSGQIIAQLTDARLIDEYQIVVTSTVLGSGRTMFEGVRGRPNLSLQRTRSFSNGNVVLWYSIS